jgi:hypothetical protein
MTPLQGLPLFYGPDPGRCPGLSHGAPLGLGRQGSSTASARWGWEGVVRPRRLPVGAGKAWYIGPPLPVGANGTMTFRLGALFRPAGFAEAAESLNERVLAMGVDI